MLVGPTFSDQGESHPSISPDGNAIYFDSSRVIAGSNLFVSTRSNAGVVFSTPAKITGDFLIDPGITSDGNALYAANLSSGLIVRMAKAGVSFGVMQEERCHGEVARRLGEEYLYQTVQAENVEAINQYSYKKVITHCPHCFNTIKNEFPQLGGTYEVLHHSQVIDDLVSSGRIKPIKPLTATVVFHDSCYLGRYNGIMDAPRRVAAAVPGLRVVDPPRARERGLCCGGGGGHMWMEIKSEKRVNVIRTEELLATGAGTVATACPFCLAMVDLGRKVVGAEERLAVKDVSELVAESLG